VSALIAFFAGPIGRWIVIGLVVATAATTAYLWAYNAGYAKHKAETVAAIAEANQRAREAERDAAERLAKVVTDNRKVVTDAQAEITRLRASVRDGTRRLSVRVASVPGCPGATPTAGVGSEARAELDPATADDLVAIAADGDAAIRQSNALIDAYAIARETCGK